MIHQAFAPARTRLVIDTNSLSMYSYMAIRGEFKRKPAPHVMELIRQFKLTHPESPEWETRKQAVEQAKADSVFVAWRRMMFEAIAFCSLEVRADDLIFTGDPRGKKWRHDIYPDYKGNRKARSLFPTEEEEVRYYVEVDGLFWDKLPKVMGNVGFFRIPGIEADDIIATIVKKFPMDQIILISGDGDFVQLLQHANFRLYNPKAKQRGFVMCDDPKYALAAKIWSGDDSDSIKNVFRGCGEKTVAEILGDPSRAAKLAEEHHERYDLNRRLIDMDLIPKHITDQITSELDARVAGQCNMRMLHSLAVTEQLFDFRRNLWIAFRDLVANVRGGW